MIYKPFNQYSMSIIGHQKILNFFNQAITNGQLSHAYCFSGPSQVGKRAVAESLATQLLKTTKDRLTIHPDYHLVEQARDEKTYKTKKDITLAQIHRLRAFISQSALLGSYRIVIIDEAEKMNIQAANALLKTLEESRGNACLFLITQNETALPITVLSRCQRLFFSSVPTAEIVSYLSSFYEKKQAEMLAKQTRGLPGLAVRWANSEKEYEKYVAQVKRFTGLLGISFHDRLKNVEDLFVGTDHISIRGELYEVLDIWQLLVRDIMYQTMSLPQFQVHDITSQHSWTSEQLVQVEKIIWKAKEYINKNIHPKLLFEEILLALP